MSRQKQNLLYVLDSFSHRDVKRWKRQYQAISAYCWDHYSYFAHQRSRIADQLKASLIGNSISYEFSNWRRAVESKFNHDPFSAKGSILNETGGRFNIGDIDQIKFPKFAGLYLAEDTVTALREKYGLDAQENISGLTAQELNIAGNFSVFNVKGQLTNVLDLCNVDSLNDFFSQIKTIHLPTSFITRAKRLGISAMLPVHNTKELLNTLLREDWRIMPMQFDIPSNPQILGHLAYAAGIEAILYPLVKTHNKCLVIYPENFQQSSAYIEIEGDPPKGVVHGRIDRNTFNNFI